VAILPSLTNHQSSIKNFSLSALESFLETMTLSDAHRALKGFEQDLAGDLNPTHLLHFLFWERRIWLDFADFANFYRKKNLTHLHEEHGTAIAALGNTFEAHLAARLYRTQFGFLTEYHAALLTEDVFRKHSFELLRSPDLDRHGVDFQLRRRRDLYNIHIFIDSPRAWHYRNMKRTTKSSNHLAGVHIDFPYTVKPDCIHSLRLLKNGFGVYSRRYAEHLKEKILSGEAGGTQAADVDCQHGLRFDV
jgi:hypothetical protein